VACDSREQICAAIVGSTARETDERWKAALRYCQIKIKLFVG